MKYIIKCLAVAVLCFSVVACSRIKNYFPDKTKEYQLAKQTPELTLPAGFSTSIISAVTQQEAESSIPTALSKPSATVASLLAAPPHISPIVPAKPSTTVAVNQTKPAALATTDAAETASSVALVDPTSGAKRIRIKASMANTWRTVGKALSRHAIEITKRNQRQRVYFVQYDASFKQVQDDSWWDELMFVFGPDPVREEELRVKLVEQGAFIEVTVLDRNGTPLSTGNGLQLLKLLHKTLKQDLAV